MGVYRIFALPSLICSLFCMWLMVQLLCVSKMRQSEDLWLSIVIFLCGCRLFLASLGMNTTHPPLSLFFERTGYLSLVLLIPVLPIFVHSFVKEKGRSICTAIFVIFGLSLLPFVYSEHFVSSNFITYTVFGAPNTLHYSGSSEIMHRIWSLGLFGSIIYCQVLLIKYFRLNPHHQYTLLIVVGIAIAVAAGLFDIISMLVPLNTPAFFEYGMFIFVSLTTYALMARNRMERESAFEELKKAKDDLESYAENLENKVKERTLEYQDQRDKVVRAHNLLSKYITPQLIEKVLSEQIDLVWEYHRKKLTLFFSDIQDFTKITDGMEPEDMAGLLNEYLSIMTNIIEKHGGTLASISGDGLFVFFGAPDATNDQDHAVRCIRMAIDMQQALIGLNHKSFDGGIEDQILVRCGINTGVATVGGYGSDKRKEYTAIGMQVNLASRLENTCEAGRILVSHSTWALTRKYFEFEERGQLQLKGFHRPFKAYYLINSSVHSF
jgi:class 3 adenylate cyclase